MGVQRGPKIPTENIWGYWDAASKHSYPGSGTTWKSLTGSPDATMSGSSAPTYSSFNKGCIYFDGGSGAVTIADDDLEVSGAFTFSIWIYPSDPALGYTVFSLRGGTAWSSKEFCLAIGNPDPMGWSIRMGCKGSGCTMNRWDDDYLSPDANIDTWRQYLVVYDGGAITAKSSFKLYFDGVLVGTTSIDYTWGVAYNGTSWGRDGHSGTNGLYTGYLGPVLLYDKAFTASEVWDLYTQQRGRFQ